ncbi:fasciclin domain-containing protein [Parapedobacter sp. DT-150]|uniref:fasciclin domain-containing protein n=1 Tax=Parapedobacter sp. DT-150 TaxID=3396162 RepID=UPI003F53E784
MAYLDSRPIELDSIAQIVRLAGLEETFNIEEFTFFAPRDEEIKRLIGQVNYEGEDPLLSGGLNQLLYDFGLDTIQTLADVDSAIWRKYLERYMFRGKHLLKDYPQVDLDVLSAFGGQNYYAYNNTVSNIGVVYHDAVTNAGLPTETRLKYMGYRQLHLSYIPNVSEPDNWNTYRVSSSDIQPTNGVVHVLDFNIGDGFGLNVMEVILDIVQSKR